MHREKLGEHGALVSGGLLTAGSMTRRRTHSRPPLGSQAAWVAGGHTRRS